jgi:hypothetical protein
MVALDSMRKPKSRNMIVYREFNKRRGVFYTQFFHNAMAMVLDRALAERHHFTYIRAGEAFGYMP